MVNGDCCCCYAAVVISLPKYENTTLQERKKIHLNGKYFCKINLFALECMYTYIFLWVISGECGLAGDGIELKWGEWVFGMSVRMGIGSGMGL